MAPWKITMLKFGKPSISMDHAPFSMSIMVFPWFSHGLPIKSEGATSGSRRRRWRRWRRRRRPWRAAGRLGGTRGEAEEMWQVRRKRHGNVMEMSWKCHGKYMNIYEHV